MSKWTVLGVVLALFLGACHGFGEACWELAVGRLGRV